MTTEDSIQTEMRLFALESIVCQHLAGIYQAMPRAIFDEVKKQAAEGAKKQTFPGLGAVYSDLLSAELLTSLERLYGIIQHHLDNAQKRQPK
jgi:hypothetical protein